MRRIPAIAWLAVGLALGFAGGILYRRVYNPTLEERVEAAAKEMEKGVKNAADRLKR